MAEDVKRQHSRIGGDFAVANAIPRRSIRDEIRKVLPEVIFVLLSLSKDSQRERIVARQGNATEAIVKHLQNLYKYHEAKGCDEKNVITIEISQDMTPIDVKNEILMELENFKK